MNPNRIGIIGGSGLYQLDALKNSEWVSVATPFGDPSDQLCFGKLGDLEVVFLPRHGRGHKISPSRINYRANIHAMKSSGVSRILSVSAVGSLKEHLSPGTFVIVDQFIDRTFAREKSFFEVGLVAHVSMAEPTCKCLREDVQQAAKKLGIPHQMGGTYLTMEGPQFSTKAESHLYRSWNCDVIGMTNMPEAKLAREAEMCYASVAMVTDYDCWHEEHGHVDVATVMRVMSENSEKARKLVDAVIPTLAKKSCPHGCQESLTYALVTPPEARDPKILEKLKAIIGRVVQ